jgi:hypothetical protein
MHHSLKGLDRLSRFAADGRIVKNLALAAELADAGVVGAADVAGLFEMGLVTGWFDGVWSWVGGFFGLVERAPLDWTVRPSGLLAAGWMPLCRL